MKFIITRTDGKPIPPEAKFFVLRLDEHGTPAKTAAARAALRVFAKDIEEHDHAAAKAALDLIAFTRPRGTTMDVG